MSFQPESDQEDAKRAAAFLRTLDDAALIQAASSPRVLVNQLPGFTMDHIRTAAETVIIGLVWAEQHRRSEAVIDRVSQKPLWVSIGSLVISVPALAGSIFWRGPSH